MSFDEVIDQALTLPVEQRSRLAGVLISSLEQEEGSLSPQWRQEISKRAQELESGSVRGLSLEAFESVVAARLK